MLLSTGFSVTEEFFKEQMVNREVKRETAGQDGGMAGAERL